MLADGSNNSLELAFPLRLNPKIKGVSFQRVRDHGLAFSHIGSYVSLQKKGPPRSGPPQRFCVGCAYLLILTSQKFLILFEKHEMNSQQDVKFTFSLSARRNWKQSSKAESWQWRFPETETEAHGCTAIVHPTYSRSDPDAPALSVFACILRTCFHLNPDGCRD